MWIMNIANIVKSKNNKLEIVKVKSHSEDKWNDKADVLAKKGATCRNIIYAEKIRCDGIEYRLEWENKKIDIPTRLLCKIITNAKIGASWRETNPIRALEPETENTRHNWSSFWKEMNRTKGVHCTSRKLSTRRATAIKCIMNNLPTLEELNKRRPEVYTTVDCQMCQDGEKETQAHLASCSGQKSLWKRIQKVTTATAWNELKEKDKIRIPPQVLHKVLFGETEAEEITNRKALMKGLITLKVKKEIERLLTKQATQKCIDIVTRTVWNTFYDQVWRTRCERIQEWEKRINITSKMKKGVRTSEKLEKRKGKSKQTKKEEKEKKIKKPNRMKKEAWKTINMLVTEGARPFWYGFK